MKYINTVDIIKEEVAIIKKLNLKTDIIFRTFFSRKGNEYFLIDFLNALLNVEIKSIKIRDEVSLERLSTFEKGGRLDLQAKLDNGTIVNIEMQVSDEGNITQRTAFYSSKVISKETEKGTKYKDISKVIMINILDYDLLDFSECVSKTAIVLDKHRDYEIIDGITWYFIELPKFRKSNPNMENKLNQWLAIIDDYDKEMIELAEKNNQIIEKAKIELGTLTGDEEIKRIAELKEKWEMDYNSAVQNAEERGLTQGRAEGHVAGIAEEKRNIAKKLISLNIPKEKIIEITGLIEEEIEKLKEE